MQQRDDAEILQRVAARFYQGAFVQHENFVERIEPAPAAEPVEPSPYQQALARIRRFLRRREED